MFHLFHVSMMIFARRTSGLTLLRAPGWWDRSGSRCFPHPTARCIQPWWTFMMRAATWGELIWSIVVTRPWILVQFSNKPDGGQQCQIQSVTFFAFGSDPLPPYFLESVTKNLFIFKFVFLGKFLPNNRLVHLLYTNLHPSYPTIPNSFVLKSLTCLLTLPPSDFCFGRPPFRWNIYYWL